MAIGEIAHLEQFILLSQCFQKSSAVKGSEGVCIWERFNWTFAPRLAILGSYWPGELWRLRSACAYAQSHENLHLRHVCQIDIDAYPDKSIIRVSPLLVRVYNFRWFQLVESIWPPNGMPRLTSVSQYFRIFMQTHLHSSVVLIHTPFNTSTGQITPKSP